MALTSKLSAIADAIRAKTGSTAAMTIDQMPDEIASITTGGGDMTNKLVCTIGTGIKNGSDIRPPYGTISFSGLDKLDTSKLTSIISMFQGCSKLTSIDLSSLNTSNIITMDSAFYGCSSLTSLDLSSFNTSKVTGMSSMFRGCSSLTSIDLSSFNASIVSSMSYMFYGCSKLTSLDLSSFNASKVSSMSYMFATCSSLTSLDLSSFNTSNVSNMSYMFNGCSKLQTLIIGSSTDTTSQKLSITNAFSSCPNVNIYVPDPLVDVYKTATNWSQYADNIKPQSELEAS